MNELLNQDEGIKNLDGESVDMNERKEYRDDLLEWCETAQLNWESMKSRFSKQFDLESLKEWEESCRELKVKLEENINVDFEEYEKAKRLYEQFELLYRESYAVQKEDDAESRLEMEIENEVEESNSFNLEVESGEYDDSLEQNQYREDLLEWCNKLYTNWNRMKPKLEKHVDTESIEGWEGLYSYLTEKLRDDRTADSDDYEVAYTLYEQWERLLEESYDLQEEIVG